MAFLDDLESGISSAVDTVKTDVSSAYNAIEGDASSLYNNISNVWSSVQNASLSKNPANQEYTEPSQVFGLAGEKGFTSNNTPKIKFSFIVEFVLSSKAKSFVQSLYGANGFDVNSCSYFVRETDLPSASFNMEITNQYNRSRIRAGKLKYKPVTMSFFDTSNSEALKLLTAYKKYYFGDFYSKNAAARTYDVLSSANTFEGVADNWGYSVRNVGNYDDSYFFTAINIYEIDGDRYTCHNLFNPKIESYTPEKKSHDATTEISTLQLEIVYESSANLAPDGVSQAIAAPTLGIAKLITSTGKLDKGGYYKLYGETDDKTVGTTVGDLIRGAGAVNDIINDVKSIANGNVTPDTIRNMGSAIKTGTSVLTGSSSAISSISDKFGIGNIFGS